MKNNQLLIIGIVIVVALLIGIQLGLFSIFIPEEEKLTQYAVTNLNNLEFLDYIRGTSFSQPSNIYNQNYDPLLNTFVDTTTIVNTGKNEFKFVTTGLSIIQDQLCTQTVNVYKNNVLIDTFEKYDSNSATQNRYIKEIYYDDASQDSYVTFQVIKQPYFTGCGFAVNTYSIQLADDSFDFNIYTLTTTFIEGQDVIVYAEIDNKLTQTYLADVEVTFKTPTLFGFAEKTIIKNDVTLSPGINTVELILTPQTSAGSIEITPKLNLKASENSFSGLNYGISNTEYYTDNIDPYQCSGNNMVPHCGWHSSAKKKIEDWVPIGSIEGDTQLISVSPKPLYLELGEGETCPLGYSLSYNQEYCVRDDIQDLGCVILGCPTIPGHEYICSSSGMCVETVFVDRVCLNDLMCPNETTCDVNSGLCIKTEIFWGVINCENSDDCVIPCSGITATCAETKCVYSGECTPVEVGCNEYGCPLGYTCDTQLNVCKSEDGNGDFNLKSIWDDYKILIIIAGGIIFFIFVVGRKK